MHWGEKRENGIWRSKVRTRKWMWTNHDALYVALGHWRLRLMKPEWML